MNSSELTEPENWHFFQKFSNVFKLESVMQSYTSNNQVNFTEKQINYNILIYYVLIYSSIIC